MCPSKIHDPDTVSIAVKHKRDDSCICSNFLKVLKARAPCRTSFVAFSVSVAILNSNRGLATDPDYSTTTASSNVQCDTETHIKIDSSKTRPTMEGRKISFLDLPAEIRNEIYLLALPVHTTIQLSESLPEKATSTKQYFHEEPALLAVSRQIREEASPVFYGINTFQTPYSSRTIAFLDQLGMERARMLRNLRAFSSHVVLFGTNRETWLDTVLRATKRLLKECGACLHRDALLVPFKEGDGLTWKRLSEIEKFEIVGEKYDWSLRKKSDEKDRAWRALFKA